jgi:hypothetical protein
LSIKKIYRFIYGKWIDKFASLAQAKEVATFAHKWQIKYLGDIAVTHFDLFAISAGQYLHLYEICKNLGDKLKTSEYFQVIIKIKMFINYVSVQIFCINF